ncbi:MAG: hypothetical protein ACRDFT_07375 [bacterium]
MARRTVVTLLVGVGVVALGALLYVAGFHAGAQGAAANATGHVPVAAAPVQTPPPLQEFIPLPMPGRPENQPGQGNQQGQDCEPVILFYFEGRLYQLQPGQGPEGQRGRPGSPPEYFPLTPYQGPAIPGLPGVPFGPGPGTPAPGNPPNFQPQNPRF